MLGLAISAGIALIAYPVQAAMIPVYSSNSSTSDPNVSAGGTTSYNWAGYVAEKGSYTSVTGTWTVPSATSNNNLAADAAWVGIGGIESDDLIQAGTQAVVQNGSTEYLAWIETLPDVSQQVPLDISPGDSITATLTQVSTSQNLWNISIKNNTQGTSYTTRVTYNSSLSSAEWIEEMPLSDRGFIPLDEFGSITFTNASTVENGVQESIADSGADMITMLNDNRQVSATVSALTNNGTAFTVTKTNAPSTSHVTGRRRQRGGEIPNVITITIPDSTSTDIRQQTPQNIQDLITQINQWQQEVLKQFKNQTQYVSSQTHNHSTSRWRYYTY